MLTSPGSGHPMRVGKPEVCARNTARDWVGVHYGWYGPPPGSAHRVLPQPAVLHDQGAFWYMVCTNL